MTMSKNSRITVAVAFALSVGVTFAIIKLKQPASKSIGSPLASLPSPSQLAPPAPTDKVYQDESGFSFKYPSDLTVSDDTPDDDIYYSRLKLKKADGTMLELSIKDVSTSSKVRITTIGKKSIARLSPLSLKASSRPSLPPANLPPPTQFTKQKR